MTNKELFDRLDPLVKPFIVLLVTSSVGVTIKINAGVSVIFKAFAMLLNSLLYCSSMSVESVRKKYWKAALLDLFLLL